ncbi:MAG: ribbon-helix-helix protein, CopG family [Candidatus Omnitrophica bacterium]|nr:ribbon-helix-helix protein, CopG family [Candidatus Omnitrophota bacterium]
MRTVTVNISFPQRLLKAVDRTAKKEDRTRSELLRQACRMYLENKDRLTNAMNTLRAEARKAGYKPEDVESWIAEVRKSRRAA